MADGNAWLLWLAAGLLALLSLGQTLRVAVETQVGVAVHGLPADLCREVVAEGRLPITKAAQIYAVCWGAGVHSEALCAQVVRGKLSVREALDLYRHFPRMSEWSWRQLRPVTVGYMLAPNNRDWDWKSILAGRIWIGMTDTQALVAWGLPTNIWRTVTARETRERWVYRGGGLDGTRHLTFRNGILTSIETRRS
jgi:hypothetical protein